MLSIFTLPSETRQWMSLLHFTLKPTERSLDLCFLFSEMEILYYITVSRSKSAIVH